MYRLKFNCCGHAKGTVVYPLAGTDYGNASMDSFYTQIPHLSVTLNPGGEYPFFTVAEHNLERI
jgi:hypothetical protein